MTSQLRKGKKLVGIKQSRRAIKNNEAATVYIAEDAEQRIKAPFFELCAEMSVNVIDVPTMRELGEACGIDVGAAVAVLLK